MASIPSPSPPLVDDMPSAPLSTDRSASIVKRAVARDQFEILYPTIRGFLLSQFEAHSMPQDAIEYFTRVRRPSSLLYRPAHLKDLVSRPQHIQR